MAVETSNPVEMGMGTAAHIPIAQLTPLLNAPATRYVKAIVTLTWPYSSATGAIAFLLSEPDFRLRRVRGQVRVQFAGSTAKRVAKAGIASGDEIILCLDGVEWLENQDTASTPGRGVDVELKFTERLYLQFKPEEDADFTTLDIDHPPPEADAAPAFARIPTPEPEPSPSLPITSRTSIEPGIFSELTNEWSSPAFLKRARTSYGSLFEEDYDPFLEDDGTVQGKGRKRTRLSAVWKYNSRTPSPEVEDPMEEVVAEPSPKPPPTMTDEACQTDGLETENAAETLAKFARQATNAGGTSYTSLLNGSQPSDYVTSSNMAGAAENMSMPATESRPSPETTSTSINQAEAVFLPHNAESQLSRDITPVEEEAEETSSTPPTESRPSAGMDHDGDVQSMPPPRIQTQPPEIVSDPISEVNRKLPSSPRLEPISSDSLPLVSPLISNNFGSHNFGFSFGRPLQVTQDKPTKEQPESVNERREVDEEEEDLYGASPIRQRSNPVTHEFNGFLEPPGGGQNADFPAINKSVAIEHQYGQWSSVNAYSQNPSPSRENGYSYEEPPQSDEENESEDDLSAPQRRTSQYPEIESDFTSDVRYPELSDLRNEMDVDDYEDDADHAHLNSPPPPPPPHGQAMSRSQSAQSPVIDLTEDSEDGLAEEGDMSDARESSVEEFFSDEEQQAEAKALRKYGVEYQHGIYSDEGDADAEGEEDFEDDSTLDPHERYARRARPQDYAEEEESEEDAWDEQGSYDDEGMEEKPVPRGDPVVIELSSDDDDDDGDEADQPQNNVPGALQMSRSQSYQRSPAEPANGSGSDEEDVEIDQHEAENSIPYAERDEIRTNLGREFAQQSDYIPLQAGQEDNAMYEADGEEMLSQGQDEASQIGDESPMQPKAQRTYSLSSGSGEENGEDEQSESEGSEDNGSDQEMGDEKNYAIDVENDEPKTKEGEEVQTTKDDMEHVQHPDSRSPQRPLSSSNMIHFDGANDERSPTMVSYPLFSNETSFGAKLESHSWERPELLQQTSNLQLPTPEMSQPVEQLIVTKSSFTSTVEEVKSEILTDRNDLQHHFHVESSTEVKEVTSQVLSVDLNVKNPDDERPSPCLAEPEAVKEDLPETDDVLMSEPINEEPESANEVGSSIIDSSIVREVKEEEQSSQLDQSAVNEFSMVEEVVEEDEKSQLDQSAIDDDVDEDGSDAKLQDSHEQENSQMQEASEVEDESGTQDQSVPSETIATEQQGRMTRSAAHALANADHSATQEKPVEEAAKDQQNHDDADTEEPEFTAEHPRRSHRRIKFTATAATNDDVARPVTPVKSRPSTSGKDTTNEQKSPMVVIESHSAPKGHDASFELALSSLESPAKPAHDLRKPLVADVKAILSRTLRTELSEFTQLKVIRYHQTKKLDILAVATTTPPEPARAKSGPRNYQITFNITDASIAPSGVTEVQIFRPYKEALPTVSVGDGILLRNFQVISVQGGYALRSTVDEGSSWAVFNDGEDPEMRGPPVEFGEGEKNYAVALRSWFAGLDGVSKTKIERANANKAARR